MTITESETSPQTARITLSRANLPKSDRRGLPRSGAPERGRDTTGTAARVSGADRVGERCDVTSDVGLRGIGDPGIGAAV